MVESSQEFVARMLSGQVAPKVRLSWTTYGNLHDEVGDGANMSLAMIARGGMLVAYFFPTETEEDPNADTMNHAFRDRFDDFMRLNVQVVGVSAQTALAQQQCEVNEVFPLDIPLPQHLLSDTDMELAGELALPTFETDGHGEYEPLTIVFDADRIVHVVYPIESPRAHIDGVLDWLAQREVAG